MPDLSNLNTVSAIQAANLSKRYGDTLSVDDLSLDVSQGQFFGLLGPNGSGKTSTIHMLSTLIRPTFGEAYIAGFNVVRDSVKVRREIGVVFQESALDRTLTVSENLRFAGLLHDLSRGEIRQRSKELLALFGLEEKRNRPVMTLSGGMRRALDIARGVIHQPRILFLDEPTLGLDLPNRRNIWRFLNRLRVDTGMTVFLTTHYLEEAANCDEVAFMRAGRIVKRGAPCAMIESVGQFIIEIEGNELKPVIEDLSDCLGAALIDGDRAYFRFNGDIASLTSLQAELGQRVSALRWRRPNLNDVFLWVNETGL